MMADVRTGRVLTSWQTLLEAGSAVAGLTDGMLLERFAARRTVPPGGFFYSLGRGGMVRWCGQVCRRLLDDPHDAEDAFQATFSCRARKAGRSGIPTGSRAGCMARLIVCRPSSRWTLRGGVGMRRGRPCPKRAGSTIRAAETKPRSFSRKSPGCPRQSSRGPVRAEGLTEDEAARSRGHSDRTRRRQLSRAHDLLRSLAHPGAGSSQTQERL